MSISREYVRQLEDLIILKLLPIYVEHYKNKNMDPPYDKVLIQFYGKMLKKKSQELPALLRKQRP